MTYRSNPDRIIVKKHPSNRIVILVAASARYGLTYKSLIKKFLLTHNQLIYIAGPSRGGLRFRTAVLIVAHWEKGTQWASSKMRTISQTIASPTVSHGTSGITAANLQASVLFAEESALQAFRHSLVATCQTQNALIATVYIGINEPTVVSSKKVI